ncbi:MAG: flagellar protein FlgN [Planctomycetota bacterium]|jgi:flagellar biosynthesis/type III secretory pathway chaperone|nr:flagellar protein FlgN [Planctomycetota bacterium]
MQTAVAALTAILTTDVALHERMLAAADAKRAAIMTGDLPAMEASLNAEYDLIEKIRAQAPQREALVADLAAKLAVAEQPPTLRALTAKLPPEWRGEIDAAREKLKTVLEKLRLRLRANTELLKASMDHAQAFMEMLRHSGDEAQTYNRHGKMERAPARLINRRA